MIGILKSNLLISPLVLFVLTILLRIKGFISMPVYELTGTEGPVYLFLYPLFSIGWIQVCLSIFLVFVQAYLVNRLVLLHNLMRPPNFIAAFWYIILCGLSIDFLGIHPVLLANTFIILAVGELYKIYKNPRSAIHIFNAGFLFAIASLCYFPIVLFYLACSIIITIIRSYNLIERIQLLIGFLMPFYLLSISYYLRDDLAAFWNENFNLVFHLPSFNAFGQVNNITIIFYAVVMLIAVLYYRQFTIKKGIQIEKKIASLYWICVLSFLTVIITPVINVNHLLLLAFPLSIFMAMFILNFKFRVIPEFIAISSMILLFILHYFIAN